jgi:hypothetical protein
MRERAVVRLISGHALLMKSFGRREVGPAQGAIFTAAGLLEAEAN